MKNRSELREIIMKVIYQTYILDKTKNNYDVDDLIKEQLEVENDYVRDCINGIIKNQKEINTLANKHMNNWTIDRLNKVDQAIISLGIYELIYTDTPSIVAINEAIELSKKYSEEAVTKMINGGYNGLEDREKRFDKILKILR